ncbi:MAG: putative glycoside hydrolase [Sulfurimonas sp.]|uniref:putative glycoside hydrolase n=1 Tax=Sulfurimonas sp. TaxID=2022749 RepID=UPI0028CBEB06|nr:putative glycoside hydrolase [Sulfurimonas sp.]MDT8338252.1 putative glycoside hydrolase [Sulfurimonas sp.]
MRKLLLSFFLLETFLWGSFSGTIVDKTTSLPIGNATVNDSRLSVKSDENGTFFIDSNEDKIFIKAYGYRAYKLDKDEDNDTIAKLEPITVKALYLSFWRASNNSPRLKDILEIIDKTEINSIVVDVKSEYGSTSYKTSFEKANGYGAHNDRTNRDIEQFMKLMKSKNIYTIARIVTFKDELQASNNPEYAIKKRDGTLWRNHDEMAWVDPFDKRAHEYTVSIAEDAARVGFDEINFDYIRFPAKDGLTFSKESTQQNRVKAISDFLKLAQNRLRKYGVFISVDTYGNICWEDHDMGIGQMIEPLAKYADYLSPMLYPSGFSKGSFGLENPSEHPHMVIYKSLKNIEDQIESKRLRPWLQSFKDYAHRKIAYNFFEINEQIRATADTNTSGWMLWSPSSTYELTHFRIQERDVLTLDSTRENPEYID